MTMEGQDPMSDIIPVTSVAALVVAAISLVIGFRAFRMSGRRITIDSPEFDADAGQHRLRICVRGIGNADVEIEDAWADLFGRTVTTLPSRLRAGSPLDLYFFTETLPPARYLGHQVEVRIGLGDGRVVCKRLAVADLARRSWRARSPERDRTPEAHQHLSDLPRPVEVSNVDRGGDPRESVSDEDARTTPGAITLEAPRRRLLIVCLSRKPDERFHRLRADLSPSIGSWDITEGVESAAMGADMVSHARDLAAESDTVLVVVDPASMDELVADTDAASGGGADEEHLHWVAATAALATGIPTLAVLVADAPPLRSSCLPEDVRELAHRKPFVMRDDHWERDLANLAEHLNQQPSFGYSMAVDLV